MKKKRIFKIEQFVTYVRPNDKITFQKCFLGPLGLVRIGEVRMRKEKMIR
jgi:hypothetical protein